MEEVSEKLTIERLTGKDNYWAWKPQVKRTLISRGLWNVIQEAKNLPEEGQSTTPDLTKDAAASSFIIRTCGKGPLKMIVYMDTAKQQWDRLEALYETTGITELGIKSDTFYFFKLEKDIAIRDISNRLDTLQFEIGILDPTEKPSERQKIAALFKAATSLNTGYSTLVAQLNA